MADGEMRYGAVLPGGSAPEQLEQAVLAERAGWDGVFVWEAAYGVDAWSLLAAMAARTSRVRLGTILTPLPWRRPWKVASQVATLDQLSGGRAILAVGVGAFGTDLPDAGEETGIRPRAEMMDEGIDLIRMLWDGGGSYEGRHYQFRSGRLDLASAARPVQDRIPVWVAALWPRPKSMRRVLRCDGVLPETRDQELRPDDIRAARAWLAEQGARPDLDVVIDGETPADDQGAAAAQVAPWAGAGGTWWLETRWGMPDSTSERVKDMTDRLAAGPPGPPGALRPPAQSRQPDEGAKR
jgi:alkanesulfonate monooxygenase SsuD/methylene tetrahydromethanopterin reductase-like flavin-dependent oxidoreductase (luciferase family)